MALLGVAAAPSVDDRRRALRAPCPFVCRRGLAVQCWLLPVGRRARACARTDRCDHWRHLTGVRGLRFDLDAGGGHGQRRPVRASSASRLSLVTWFSGLAICASWSARGAGRVRGGSRSRRHVHPRRRSDDAERRRQAFAPPPTHGESASRDFQPAISHECNEATDSTTTWRPNEMAETTDPSARSDGSAPTTCPVCSAGSPDSGSGRGASSASSSRPPS